MFFIASRHQALYTFPYPSCIFELETVTTACQQQAPLIHELHELQSPVGITAERHPESMIGQSIQGAECSGSIRGVHGEHSHASLGGLSDVVASDRRQRR
jgi:hypothetical protein